MKRTLKEILLKHPDMSLIYRSDDDGLVTKIFADSGYLVKALQWDGVDGTKEIVYEMDRGTIESYANWLRERGE